MNDELLGILNKNYKADMINYINQNPEQIDSLINLILLNDSKLSWRAAWLLWSCLDNNDFRIVGNSSKFIDILPISNESMQRELLKILYPLELNEDLLGKLFNICINIWEDINKRPGVRYNAFKMIVKITNQFPELKKEIDFLLDDRFMKTLSPGIKHSLKKFYKLSIFQSES